MEPKIKYTIGIMFNENFKKVILIKKNRPEWQKDKYNFPGGHIEKNEEGYHCIAREFKEECNISSAIMDWKKIGIIRSTLNYTVEIFTSRYNKINGKLKTNEDQKVSWKKIHKLPKNIISNVKWLTEFALNIWKQGNIDNLSYGIFYYNKKI